MTMRTELKEYTGTELSKPLGEVSGTASDCSTSDDQDQLSTVAVPVTSETTTTQAKSLRDIVEPRFWSCVVLAVLAASAPLILTCTALVVAFYRVFVSSPPEPKPNGKVAIISGGKMT